MKPTILTPAILMAAALFAATTAHAQAQGAASAFPPGPSAQASSQGPTGQATATAQTSNVNVVNTPGVSILNAPTVQVGNEVTVKEQPRQPFYAQKQSQLVANVMYGPTMTVEAPAGSRLVIETISLGCSSASLQPVIASVYRPTLSSAVVSLLPPPIPWGTGSFSVLSAPVRLLVDDSLSLIVYRPTGNGLTDCAVTFIGYTTPLQ